jgi:predicted outer membrane lipoprotein
MARALIAVGALLAVAFAVLLAVVFESRDEDRVAVDNVLALELTRAIGTAGDGDRVDLRALAPFDWDRVLVVAPGTARDAVSAAVGAPYLGDLPYGSSGPVFVFARGDRLARFADYRGRATFSGFERPLDELARADAELVVRGGIVTPAP